MTSKPRSSRTVESLEGLSRLGPGLITGAADDDPSGIATYSQAGALAGFGVLWTVVLTLPLMVGIQTVSARVGCITHRGLAANLIKVYPKSLIGMAVVLLLLANIFNIAADLNAMGACARMVLGGSTYVYLVAFGILSLILQIWVPYKQYIRVLKWLTLSLFAYVATLLTIKTPWWDVARAVALPHLHWSKEYLTLIVAIFGTTISPYLFFWQSANEVGEAKDRGDTKRVTMPAKAMANFRRINLDTWVGMGLSNLIAFCIMVTTAVVLHMHGETSIQTTEQAAAALKPIAGDLAFALFSLGIIGAGMLALPVLAGSAAFAVSDVFGWRSGLDYLLHQARAFYLVLAAAMVAGIVLCLTNLDPIKALLWSAVINGVVAVPMMALMMAVSQRHDIMKKFVVSGIVAWFGWGATGAMTIVVIGMISTLF